MKLLKKRVAGMLVSSLVTMQVAMSGVNIYAAEVVKEQGATIEGEGTASITTGSGLQLKKLGSYSIGKKSKDGGAAEIVQFNADNNKFYVINGVDKSLEIVRLEDVLNKNTAAKKLVVNIADELNNETFTYGDITSVAMNVQKNLVAVAVQNESYDEAGRVVLLDYEGNVVQVFEVGVQPDMVTFSPDGRYILTADEGEPRNGYGAGVIDPRGSVTVIDIARGAEVAAPQIITFESFDGQREDLISKGVLLKSGAMPSADLEPEYIAVSEDSKKAYITLQEANAIAALDLATGKIEDIKGLGFKDHGEEANAIDIIKDGSIHITTAPALGVYMPDAISSYTRDGNTYLVTANEGDSRAYEAEDFPDIASSNEYSNEQKQYFKLDEAGNEVKTNKKDEAGSKVDTIDASTVDGLDESQTYLFGARSFSIWDAATMTQVFDSGSDFEKIIAETLPDYFNCSNTNTELDSRSGKKGPEPEGITVGNVGDKNYAFIVLERVGGVMIYDVTNPQSPKYESYINTRDFSEDIKGDVSGEGVDFISAAKSPTGKPLVLVANEVSGTVSVYEAQVTQDLVEETIDLTLFHTNDMHGRVVGDGKSIIGIDMIAGIKGSQEQALLIDAGDTVHGIPFATINKGKDIITLMKLAGYDVMTPGNHEFNYGSGALKELADQASTGTNDFDIISANIKNADVTNFLESQHIEVVNGIKIGMFGLSTQETLYKTNPKNVEGLKFEDPIESAKQQVASLKEQGADIIIAISHIGTDESSNPTSKMIAEQVPDIDVIIDGHSHSVYKEGYRVNNVLIASTGEYENNLGKVVLTINKKDKVLMEKAATLLDYHTATSQYVPNEVVKEEITNIKEAQQPMLDTIIGKTQVKLEGAREFVRTGETNLGNLITDAMRDLTGADIAITNGGGIRATIEAGDITKGNVIEVLPFGNYIVTKNLKGSQIKDILELGVSAYPATLGGFPHVSGMTYKFDETKAAGSRVHSIKINGKAMDMNGVYLVATNDFLAAGGDNFPHFKEAATENEYPSLDEALITYIQKLGTVSSAAEGRIVAAKESTSSSNENGGGGSSSNTNNTANKQNTSTASKQETSTGKGQSETTYAATIVFTDVKEDAWYAPAVKQLAAKGILNGRGNNKFEPNGKITRAEVAKLVSLALKMELTQEQPIQMKDIQRDAWYVPYVSTLVQKNILQGADGKIRPNDYITREELAAILERALPQLAETNTKFFKDVAPDHWSAKAINKLAAAQVIKGKSEGKFEGKSEVTRTECAVMIDRVLKLDYLN